MASLPLLAPYRRFAEKHQLIKPIGGKQLDEYLANGWYRHGSTIFTTHFLSYGKQLYSAVWIRLVLPDYKYRKSLRKVMRRIDSDFTVEAQAAIYDREREELFAKYRKGFKGTLSPSIDSYLLDEMKESMYNTWEISIRKDGRLIGLSYFDLGRDSIESIVGMYDPEYSDLSIGLYTMLAEMKFGIENEYTYYYPGYITPGNNRFGYKKRIGKPEDLEYFDLSTFSWQSMIDFKEADAPLEAMYEKLNALCAHLKKSNEISCSLLLNPIFEINLMQHVELNEEDEYLDYPLVLYIVKPDDKFEVVVYDPRSMSYKVLRCYVSLMLLIQYKDYFQHHFQKDKFLQLPLIVDGSFFESSVVEKIGAYFTVD